jgi:hypothetical protein
MKATISSRGQPRSSPPDIRRNVGLHRRVSVSFTVEDDHIAIRLVIAARQVVASGFGLIQSQFSAVPANLDAASLLPDAS